MPAFSLDIFFASIAYIKNNNSSHAFLEIYLTSF